jgi:predicted porin
LENFQMKKTLVALAALAATASFAQSTVGITGTLDIGFANANTNGSTVTNNVSGNHTSTSAVKFIGTEDLGGGMKARFNLEINPNLASSSTLNTAGNTSTGAYQAYTGTPFNGEQWVALGGGFGEVKFGTANAGALLVNGMAQPFGTALGGGYSGSFGRFGNTAGINQFYGLASNAGRIVRHEKVAQYTTPTMSGFKAMVEYAAGNGDSTTSTSNTNAFTGVMLSYANGPLNVGYSYTSIKAGSNAAATTPVVIGGAAVAGLAANTGLTYNFLAANYTFGATTVMAGYSTAKSDAATPIEDTNATNIGLKHALSPSLDLSANVLNRTSNIYAGAGKVLGLGADYKLSKRTATYVRYENRDTDTGNGTAGEVNTVAVGVRHTF